MVDARNPHPIVSMLKEKRVDLNEGMALVRGDVISHGDECIHQLALMTTPSGVFNNITALVFKSRTVSKALYPLLRFGRNTTLRLMGRTKLASRNEQGG